MGRKGEARLAATLGEIAAVQAVNQNLRHATHVQSQKDFDRFDKISNHTPVIYYIWSPRSPPCRYVGLILDQAVGAVDGSVLLVAYEVPDSKQLKELKKGGADVPYAAVTWKGEIQWGYGVNGGKGDDQALIILQPDQLPPGDFRDFHAADTSGAFYVDLLSSKEGPEAVRDVVGFALSLALADTARAVSSLEERLGVNEVSAPDAAADNSRTTTELSPAEPKFSVADELGKLADLRDRGVLSEEEFEDQKMFLLE